MRAMEFLAVAQLGNVPVMNGRDYILGAMYRVTIIHTFRGDYLRISTKLLLLETQMALI